MRRGFAAALLLACGFVASCGEIDREGMIMVLDPSVSAEIVLDSTDGIAAPDGLLWSRGTLYIADEGGSAVRAWRPGEPVRTLADSADGFASPEDLVRDAGGNLYVTDDDAGGVRQVAPDGRVTALPGASRIASSEGLALSSDGTLLVGDQQARQVSAHKAGGPALVLIAAKRGISKPEALAFDLLGNLYIGDNLDHVLYVRRTDGTLAALVSDREGFSPESLTHNARGLFITDSEHGKVYRYTPQEGLVAIATLGGSLANVQGIASDPAGNLYLSIQTDLRNRRGYILRLNMAARPSPPASI
jgi:sugar lactone lactonase YvrE